MSGESTHIRAAAADVPSDAGWILMWFDEKQGLVYQYDACDERDLAYAASVLIAEATRGEDNDNEDE